MAAVHGRLTALVRPQPHPAAPGTQRPAGCRRDLRHAVAARLGTAPGASQLTGRTDRGSRLAPVPAPRRLTRPTPVPAATRSAARSEAHTSELQSRDNLVCRL